MVLEERRVATEATLAVYTGKAFAWGRFDCARLAYRQMRALGHRPKALPAYRSAVSARTAMRKFGHETLASALDAMLPRISPAMAWVGDLVAVEGDVFEAIGIVVGNGRIFCWAEGIEIPVYFQPSSYVGAWRL